MPPSSSHSCVLLLGEEDHAAGRFLKFSLAYFSGFGSPTVLRFPLVVRGGADAVVPPDFVDRPTSIGFFQDRHDLRLGELRLAHGNLLAEVAIVPESSPY